MTGVVELVYRFEPDVQKVERTGDGIAIHVRNWKTLNVSPPTAAGADAIVALMDGATLERLAQIGGSRGSPATTPNDSRGRACWYGTSSTQRGRWPG